MTAPAPFRVIVYLFAAADVQHSIADAVFMFYAFND
jgi:formate/nitrite transporter FocA (FNT family)